MTMQAIAMLPIPEAGQEALAESRSVEVRRALASSPHLEPSIASRLAHDKDTTVSMRALRRTNDEETLANAMAKGGQRSLGASWNPLTPAESLAEAVTSGTTPLRQIALCNPATPLEARKAALTGNGAEELTRKVEPLGMAVVKAFSLVLANPWLADQPEAWTPMICRALGGMPWITQAQADAIKDRGWANWKSFVLNPSLWGEGLQSLTTSDLAAIPSSASHLAALERHDFQLEHAQRILRSDEHAEPHIIGILVRKMGIEAFEGMPPIAGTRVRSAAWLEPSVSYLPLLRNGDHADWAQATERLGNDYAAWKMFEALEKDWHGNTSSLAHAAALL